MSERIIKEVAGGRFASISERTFDDLGRLILETRYLIDPAARCLDCRGGGRVTLLTTSKPCPTCFATGKFIVDPDVRITRHYDPEPVEGVLETVKHKAAE